MPPHIPEVKSMPTATRPCTSVWKTLSFISDMEERVSSPLWRSHDSALLINSWCAAIQRRRGRYIDALERIIENNYKKHWMYSLLYKLRLNVWHHLSAKPKARLWSISIFFRQSMFKFDSFLYRKVDLKRRTLCNELVINSTNLT
jgi:hypothetical protein